MAKTKISEFDSNPANNTDIDGINLAEGMAPGLVNNAIRELMAQLKDQQAGTAGDNFTVGGNLSVTGNTTYSGTLTGSTGVLNIGSGQVYKDASGNFGLGTTSPTNRLTVSGNANVTGTFAVGSNATVTGSLTAASLAGGASTGSGASGTWGINVSGNSATTSQTNFSNLTIGGSQVLSAANYNNYAPTRTGGGASGTWGINITGNAATVTNGVYNNGGTYSINITGNAGYATNAGNASTVTNGVYNNGGTYNINISGNSASASNAVVKDWITTAGFESDQISRPYFRRASDNNVYLLVRNSSNAFAIARQSGYIEFNTDIGAVGCNYFVSDETKKANIAPASFKSSTLIDKINFIQFDWKPESGSEGHIDVGLSAQQLQSVDPRLVNKMSDGGLMINEPVLIAHMAKAIQELQAEVAALKAKVGA